MKKNLRHYSRVTAHFQASIKLECGDTLSASVENISRAGVMLSCGRETLDRTLPNVIPVSPKTPVQIKIELSIPASAHYTAIIPAYCNIVYTRRVARDEFNIGLEFVKVNEEEFEFIDHYIKTHQISA